MKESISLGSCALWKSFDIFILSVCYKLINYQAIEMIASILQSIFGPKINDQQEFVRITYRSNIRKQLATTNYTSDSGWGCMLRVLQMAIANLLCQREEANPKAIIPLFWDNSNLPFSIQTITQVSARLFPHKKPCEWYSPSEAGFLLKQLLQRFNLTYNVSICNDGSIFYQDLPRNKDNLVVLVMARIGLDKPEPMYLDALIKLMGTTFFFAILGGTPRYAHLFLKHQQGYLGFLDPHQTKKAAQTLPQLSQQTSQYFGKLQWIKREKISSSMCIMFVMDQKEIDQFWAQLLQIKQQCGQGFFLYLAQEKPVYESSNAIEILQFQ